MRLRFALLNAASSRLWPARPDLRISGRRLAGLSACLTLVAMGACTRVPQLEDRLPADLQAQPYPALIPLASALPEQTPPQEAAPQIAQSLDYRAARLRARAAALRSQEP